MATEKQISEAPKKVKKTLVQRIHNIQQSVGKLSKDKKNPFFNSQYFDINSVIENLLPLLGGEGLTVLQPLVNTDGLPALSTIVSDGETEREFISPLPQNPDPQKMGSIITYFRRYALVSLFLLQAEDDDANKGSGGVSGGRNPQNTPVNAPSRGVPTQTRGNVPPPAKTPLKAQNNEDDMIDIPGLSDASDAERGIPPISEKQIKYVMVLASQMGDDQERSRTHAFIKSAFKKEHLKQLNIEEAGTLITKLQEKVMQVQDQAQTVQLDEPDAPSSENAMDEALRKALDI